jgi:hypothetical protein
MNTYPSARELGEEALRVLKENPMTPQEHFEFLIKHGIIDRTGRVLVNRLFGAPKAGANGAAVADEQSKKTATNP